MIETYGINPGYELKESVNIDLAVSQSFFSKGFLLLIGKSKESIQNNSNTKINKYSGFLNNSNNTNSNNSNSNNQLFIKNGIFSGKVENFPLTKVNGFVEINQFLLIYGTEGLAYVKYEVEGNNIKLTLLHLEKMENEINTMVEFNGSFYSGSSTGVLACWTLGNNGLEMTGSTQIGNVRSLFNQVYQLNYNLSNFFHCWT